MVTEMSNDSTSPSLTDSRMLSADLCERGYKRVYLPSSAPLVFVSNKFADNGTGVYSRFGNYTKLNKKT